MQEQNTGADFTPDEEAAFAAMANGEVVANEAAEAAPQAEPETPAEAAPAPEPAPQPEAVKPPEGFVPHGALHQEREKRKALEAEIAAIKASKEDAKPPEWADPVTDPEGHRAWLEYKNSETTKQLEAIQNQTRQAEENKRLQDFAAQSAQEFIKTQPDYPEAFAWATQQITTALTEQGHAMSEINGAIEGMVRENLVTAQRWGVNPAELLYFRAQKAGYKSAAPAPDTRKAEEQVRAVERAQRATEGLGQGGGAAIKGEKTAEDLAEMSQAAFNELSEEDLRAAMGA